MTVTTDRASAGQRADRLAQTSAPLHPILASRWSPRAWSDAPVTREQARPLFEAARWAPSAANAQPWRFVVGHRGDSTWDVLHDALLPGNQPWAESAPLLVLAVTRTTDDLGEPRRHGPYELGLAVAQLTVQAHAEGLHVHQMAGFSPERVSDALGLPSTMTPYVVLAIGEAGHADSLDEPYRSRELAPRTRLPLDELVYAGAWGQAADLG